MTDHSPAWALIPWYGDDGLGAPTLDDWRVWADWLMVHDPDDGRDAAIAQCLTGWSLGGGWIVNLWDAAESLCGIYAHATWPSGAADGGRMQVRAARRQFMAIGFEVQPTRREMRHPRNYSAMAQATRSGRATLPPIEGVDINGCFIFDDMAAEMARVSRVSIADSRRILREAAEAFADTGAAARALGRTLRHVSSTTAGAPRNPRRRGDTGAHGRARR